MNRSMLQVLGTIALLALTAGTASAQQMFDFDGQAIAADVVGEDLFFAGKIVNGTQVDAPLPLDTLNKEYTIVVEALHLESIAVSGAQQYSGGTIRLFEDDLTAADFSDPATFSDGTALLTGELFLLERTMFLPTMGVVTGRLNWTGGSRIDDLDFSDRLDWVFLSSVNGSPDQVEDGFEERWDGKVEPQVPVVENETRSWGGLKAGFGR